MGALWDLRHGAAMAIIANWIDKIALSARAGPDSCQQLLDKTLSTLVIFVIAWPRGMTSQSES
jgi:hypothetical protein